MYWRDCDCEWLTKFCDENHVRHATVPGSLLRNHIAAVAAQRVAGYRVGVADAERKIYAPGSEALAAERAKARAPFLRLAEELEVEGRREEGQAEKLGKSITAESWWGSGAASLDAAARIRRAAEATGAGQ